MPDPTQKIHISNEFFKSMGSYRKYPINIVEQAQYGIEFLQQCSERLTERGNRLNLFVPNSNLFIPYREVGAGGKVVNQNLLSDEEVVNYLKDGLQQNAHTLNTADEYRADPAYRAL
jgi:hypothetical protein